MSAIARDMVVVLVRRHGTCIGVVSAAKGWDMCVARLAKTKKW